MSGEWVFLCDDCGGQIVGVPDRPIEDRCPGGRHICEDCGKQFGIWLDGGIIDLDEVRGAVLNPDNRFEVFGEPA